MYPGTGREEGRGEARMAVVGVGATRGVCFIHACLYVCRVNVTNVLDMLNAFATSDMGVNLDRGV